MLAFQVQYSRFDIRIYVIDVVRGLTMPLGQIAGNYAWSREGRLAFIDDNRNLQVWDGMTTTQIAQAIMGGLVWSNDGRLAFIRVRLDARYEYHDVMVWDGSTSIIVGEGEYDIYELAWSSDGRLAFVAPTFNGSQIVVWDGVNLTDVTNDSVGTNANPAWSPDGRLAFSRPDTTRGVNNIYMWDGTSLSNISQNEVAILPEWSNDGRIAFLSRMNDAWSVMVWDNGQIIDLGGLVNYSPPPMWSSDGRLVFSQTFNWQQEIMVWDSQTVTNVSQHPSMDYHPEWSDDGRLAFVSDRDGSPQIYIWDGNSLTRVYSRLPNGYLPQWWTP
jgi:Tol biopolymer transport system component